MSGLKVSWMQLRRCWRCWMFGHRYMARSDPTGRTRFRVCSICDAIRTEGDEAEREPWWKRPLL